jgi:hypothetical protein
MDASALRSRPADVTRSTVQKAVVVIADSPQSFGVLRERLGVVTTAWFAQRDFADTEILRRFQESLQEERARGADDDREEYLGMSLRELVREFKWQTLVLFKCCLLQPKVRGGWLAGLSGCRVARGADRLMCRCCSLDRDVRGSA